MMKYFSLERVNLVFFKSHIISLDNKIKEIQEIFEKNSSKEKLFYISEQEAFQSIF